MRIYQNALKGLSFLLGVCLSIFTNAQINNIGGNPNSASANVALDMQKVQISNDPFNGKVNISAPLFNYNFSGINFPISLFYAGANGIKPDELPGWVGSGWQLITGGGYVHRTVRSRPDEVQDFQIKIEKTTRYPGGFPNVDITKETNVNNKDFSYFANKNILQNSAWYSSSFATSGINRGNTLGNGNDFFNPNADYSLTTINSYPFNDLASDEYTFSVGEISGKFYLDHNNKWIVISNDGKYYQVEVNVGDLLVKEYPAAYDPNFIARYKASRMIKNFVITSVSGISYFFGSEDLNTPFNSQCFEYSRTSIIANQTSPPPFPKINGTTKPVHIEVVPHTWHLTKILNKRTGDQILFKYNSLGSEIYMSANAWSMNLWNSSSTSPLVYEALHIIPSNSINSTEQHSYGAISKIWTKKWILKEIEFSNGLQIRFSSSASNQLSSNMSGNYIGYEDVNDIAVNTIAQLNNIQVIYNTQLLKQFDFTYQSSPSNRLQLAKVSRVAEGFEQTLNTFFYDNGIALPNYGSRKTDHWGYFNNKDFFSLVSGPYNMPKMLQFSGIKDPDTVSMKAELLKKVINAGGGFAEFEYEPHVYSKYNDLSGNIVTSVNTVAGGVRIKKINNYTKSDELATTTTFDYSRPGASGQSSGVLGVGIPKYIIPATQDYSYFLANGFSPINYKGNNVTYSNVAVFQDGSGKTEYEYTNYDNGYPDTEAVENALGAYTTAILGSVYSNKSFKRGKPVSVKTYLNDNTPLQESRFKYEHDFSEVGKDELRSVYYNQWIPGSYASVRDILYPDRIREEEVEYFSQESTLTEQTKYSYDEWGNIKESIGIDGKGGLVKTKYKYAHEYIGTGSDEISQGIAFQKNLGIKNCLVEKIMIAQNSDGSNARIIDGIIYTYHTNKAFAYKEYKLQSNVPVFESGFAESKISGGVFQKDNRYNLLPEIQYTLYDKSGNVLELIDRSGYKSIFFWGYGNQYLVGKIVGAKGYNQILTESGIDTSKLRQPISNKKMTEELFSLRRVADVLVTTNTYLPLIGVDSETNPMGFTTYYRYDGFGRLSSIWDDKGNLLKRVCYNYAGGQSPCSDLGVNPTDGKYTPEWKDMGLTCDDSGPDDSYTGYQVMLQIDANPFSATYQQYRYIPTGIYNLQACPVPCNIAPECSSGDPKYKCVYGSCEEGIKVFTFSECPDGPQNGCECVYHYEWSDGSQSQDYYIITYNPCL